MKPTRINPRYLFALIVIGLMILLLSCNLGSVTMPSGGSTSNSTSQSNGLTQSGGVLNMPDPTAGLSALNSYHMSYASSIKGSQKGQDYESNLTIDEEVVKADRSELVQQTSTGNQAVYLDMVALNGASYTQQAPGGTCGAATSAEALKSGLTWQLPPVFGAKQVGQETVNAVSAMHYHFDEKSVQWQAGQNGKAQGDVWIAQPGGYVLKYQLTIQLPSGDFQGTRTWSYELSDINSVVQISLPKGCLVLINDIPVMEGASGVMQLPGFQRYVSSASQEQITQFYKDNLTAAGWSPLPGVEPQGGKGTLEYIQPQKDGRGRFAVIQVDAENGQTVVVVQSAYTRKPIVLDTTPGPGAAPATEIPVETPAAGSQSETPAVSASLPADLPQYPGASVTVKTDSMMVLMTTDGPDKVNAFYSQAMVKAGYALANSMPAAGISTQTWTKDQLQVVVAVMQQGSSTQIVLSAQQK
jgi:hypothetical protein